MIERIAEQADLLIQHRSPLHDFPLDESLHPVLQRIYRQRTLQGADQLHPDIKRLLAPEGLRGIDQAVDLLIRQLQQQGRVLIVSDFDADGATSCALAVLALRRMGFQQVDYIVPNRFQYGYGLTPEIVALALQRNPQLIITVDNGISSLEGVAAAKAAGVEVLITDHHLPGSQLPNAGAIVNPNQPGCSFASKALAGVGVIFYLMVALRSRLRKMQWFESSAITEPNLAEYLDLVALGTVADVVPLDYNNRILVAEGLQRIRAGKCRPGIMVLLELGNRRPQNTLAADLAFTVGPRLNAAGRLDDMSLGIECLLADSTIAAHSMALELDDLNRDRKQIESTMREQAFASLEQLNLEDDTVPAGICIYDETWHQGVIGILASRIKDKYHRPAIAFADADNDGSIGEIKGSARSISGYHIRDALDTIASRNPQLLQKFGGHAMAAGLTIQKKDLATFSRAFAEHAAAAISAEQLQACVITDGSLDPRHLNLETAMAILKGGPWGQGFPEPLFDGEFEIRDQRLVGDRHLKMQLTHPGAATPIDAIAFNIDTAYWPCAARRVLLVYRLDINDYRGQQSLQLKVEQMQALAG